MQLKGFVLPKTICVLLVSLFSLGVQADPNISVYFNASAKGYELFVDNAESLAVSITFDFKLKNLKLDHTGSNVFIVPAEAQNYKLVDLLIINKLKISEFTYTIKAYFGDIKNDKHTTSYKYYLPFQKGASFQIQKGYHKAELGEYIYSIDFDMPEGTPVHAAREGMVVDIEVSNSKGCPTNECAEFKNYILVNQPDGTFAEYASLKLDGAVVQKGDALEAGQLIGYSGATGKRSGPQLHFEVYSQKRSARKRFKTNFLLRKGGDDYGLLQETQRYTRNY